MKIIFNIVKWGMITAGIFVLLNVKFKEGEMTARSQSKMAEVIIDPKTNGYFTIYDDYEYSEGVFLTLKNPSVWNLFRENKIRLYVKDEDKWSQLKITDSSPRPVNMQDDAPIPFFIKHADVGQNELTGKLVNMKYEAGLQDNNHVLIYLRPWRIFCGMEFVHLLPKLMLGFGLIIVAFIGEFIWWIVVLIKKWKTNKRMKRI